MLPRLTKTQDQSKYLKEETLEADWSRITTLIGSCAGLVFLCATCGILCWSGILMLHPLDVVLVWYFYAKSSESSRTSLLNKFWTNLRFWIFLRNLVDFILFVKAAHRLFWSVYLAYESWLFWEILHCSFDLAWKPGWSHPTGDSVTVAAEKF